MRKTDTRRWTADGLEARALSIAAAVVGSAVIGGVASSKASSKASKAASESQQQSAQQGIDAQQKQFEATQALLKPYVDAGLPALQQQQALLGLGTPGQQQAAISGIESSPAFQAMLRQGEAGILSNASATGGLRGGNVQGALAQFRPQLLAQEIENRYARLGGITSLGQASAAGVGSAGMQTGSNVAALLAQQGAAQAGGRLAQGNALAGAIGGVGQGLGAYYGMGGFGGFGGSNVSSSGIGAGSGANYNLFSGTSGLGLKA